MPVPGNWELNGHGFPIYTNVDYIFHSDPPNIKCPALAIVEGDAISCVFMLFVSLGFGGIPVHHEALIGPLLA